MDEERGMNRESEVWGHLVPLIEGHFVIVPLAAGGVVAGGSRSWGQEAGLETSVSTQTPVARWRERRSWYAAGPAQESVEPLSLVRAALFICPDLTFTLRLQEPL
ncbi:hypothetical protein Q5P01_003519 [Channa striata]|uniref:Uncharacterized protein n=1 Tax=Channa striata TaxID=64152 RepID=A0AA88T1E5_CHASR|nr:hypothetical protein Q5P01_003519 [Channa striata]